MRYKALQRLANLSPDSPSEHLRDAMPYFSALIANGRVDAARKIFADASPEDRSKLIGSIDVLSAGVENISALIGDFLQFARASSNPDTLGFMIGMLAYTGQADLLSEFIAAYEKKEIDTADVLSLALSKNLFGKIDKSVDDILLRAFSHRLGEDPHNGTIAESHYYLVMTKITAGRLERAAEEKDPRKEPDDPRLFALIGQERFYSLLLKYINKLRETPGVFIFKNDELEYAFQNLPVRKFITIFCNFLGRARSISRNQSVEYFWKIYEKLKTERQKKQFLMRIFRMASSSDSGFLWDLFGDKNNAENLSSSKKEAYDWLMSLDENTLKPRQKILVRLLKGDKELWETYKQSEAKIREAWLEALAKSGTEFECPPHPALEGYSKFGFSGNVYDAVLPAMQMAAAVEQTGLGAEHAYELAILFDKPKDAMRFIDQWANHGDKQPIHDLLNFNHCDDGWHPKEWGALALKFGPKVLYWLARADQIEGKLGRVPHSIQEIKDTALALVYKKSAQFPEFAALCLEHGIAEEVFNKHIKTARKAAQRKADHIPNMGIDGADYGYPGYSLEKLPCGDLRGLVLGAITDDCQYIGNNGQVCAVHGSISEFGGFYILCKKDKKGKKNIVGQSWVWVGSKGELVFDSIEVMADSYHAPAIVLYKMAADQMIADGKFKEIRLGTGGRTPVNLPFPIIQEADASVPIDIPLFRYVDPDTGQRNGDSLRQYSLNTLYTDNPSSEEWSKIILAAREFAAAKTGAGQAAQIRRHEERQRVAAR